MATTEVVVKGAVTADGQLVLDEPPDVPPGRVEVTVRVVRERAAGEHPMFETLRRIRAELFAGGFKGRSMEEAVADVRALRDEWEARQDGLEALQDRLRAEREARAQGGTGVGPEG
ncbi:MAG: hypothetical protein FJX75_15260 [Armatimonadetes bacterium]|nr:hypothetical protein [Armatimonadota bacterium]